MENEKEKRMFSWINSKLKVKNTNEYGRGVFAISSIRKNEKLAIFGGFIMKVKDEQALSSNYDGGVQIDDDFVLSSGAIAEDTDFFNHSCDPNSGFNGQIFLVAMRDIKKGEEITFDYAMVLSKPKGIKAYKIKCLCGSNKCRKYICDDDWKNPILQKKYNGYFQYYLQEKIIKNKK